MAGKYLWNFSRAVVNAAIAIVLFIAVTLYSLFEIDESWRLVVRSFENSQFTAFQFALIALAMVAVPTFVTLLFRLRARDFDESASFLFFFWVTIAVSIVGLAGKEIIYDPILSKREVFTEFGEGLKEIFGYTVTVFAFLAGFILLYFLQEFSKLSADFEREMNTWYMMAQLLKFFKVDETKTEKPIAGTIPIENEHNASSAFDAILRFAPVEPQGGNDTGRPDEGYGSEEPSDVSQAKHTGKEEKTGSEKVLNEIFGNISKLRVEDDNDRVALDRLIAAYTELAILTSRNERQRVQTPSVLMTVLLIVSIITVAFADLAVISMFSPQDLATAAGRITLSAGFFLVAAPVTLIYLTIMDVQNPDGGHWAIDREAGISALAKRLESIKDPVSDDTGHFPNA